MIILRILGAVIAIVWITATVGVALTSGPAQDDYVRVDQGNVAVLWMAIALLDSVAAMVCIVAAAYVTQLRTNDRFRRRDRPE